MLDVSSAGDQAQCPKHMGKCLATDPYSQSNGEKKHCNSVTRLSCLNNENISTKTL
jgi:hypothetical protein